MSTRQPEILDLNIFLPPKRIIKLTERDPQSRPPGVLGALRAVLYRLGLRRSSPARTREIDLSVIPLGVTLQMEQYLAEIMEDTQEARFDHVEGVMLELLTAACQPSSPDITPEWLKRNVTVEQALAMFEFVIAPLRERAERVAAQLARQGKGKN